MIISRSEKSAGDLFWLRENIVSTFFVLSFPTVDLRVQ